MPSRLLRTLGPGDAALVKGSRVARLEDVVRAYGVPRAAAWPLAHRRPDRAPAGARATCAGGTDDERRLSSP